jgi:SAM-dependent methyltransferase
MIDTSKDHARFRATYASLELLQIFTERNADCIRLLDVGGGNGVHTHFFRDNGFEVDLVDIVDGTPERVYVGDFVDFAYPKRYDVIWASHVLEHILNPGQFVRQLLSCAKEGGFLCVTVPPAKSEMTFGHVTQWNAGLLLIHLIKAGLDCRDARVYTKGYNISIITKVKYRTNENYLKWLPSSIVVNGGYFLGDIDSLNWTVTTIPKEMQLKVRQDISAQEAYDQLSQDKKSGFVLCKEHASNAFRFHYFSPALPNLVIVS